MKRVQDLWFFKPFGPNWPRASYKASGEDIF